MKTPRKARHQVRSPKPENIEELIRRFILDRSEELFIAKGYQKTSMDMIARECGLSKPTLYTYFHGKHEIFTRLYQRLHQGLYDKIKALLALGRDRRAVLFDIINEYFHWLEAKEDFLRMYFREQHLVIHEDIEEHMAWHIESKKEMVELLSRALADIIRADIRKRFGVELIASMIFNIFEGLISDPIAHGKEHVFAQKKLIIEFLGHGVLAGED
jgi:AcrR family transcriptional regulator